MRQFISLVVGVAVMAASACLSTEVAVAQTGAQGAFHAAQAAFAVENFAGAQEFAEKAAQTDPKNPEVFLLLGKAEYQLGHLDKALAAWKQTLKLAPKEPYAAKMLDALRAQQADADTRIKLIEAMNAERLYSPAFEECRRLLGDKALTDVQRVKAMTLQADLMVKTGSHTDAQKVLQSLVVLYPKQHDPVQVALITAQAKLRNSSHIGSNSAVPSAIAALKRVVTDHPKHPAAVMAQYELLSFELKQAVTADRAEALAEWLAAHPDHEWFNDGSRLLLNAYFTLARQGAKPKKDARLTKDDFVFRALAVAGPLYARSVDAEETKELTAHLLRNIHECYTKHRAYTATLEATNLLAAMPLRRADRLVVLKDQASQKRRIAMKWLSDKAKVGELSLFAISDDNKQVLPVFSVAAMYQMIRDEYPSEPLWKEQADWAIEVNRYADKVAWPRKVTKLRLPEDWALQIAWPVVEADADADAVRAAVEMIRSIGGQIPRTDATTHKLAVSVSEKLLDMLPDDHAMWSEVADNYCTLQNDYANYLFQENIRLGRAADNAKFSAPQEAILRLLEKHLPKRAGCLPERFNLAQLITFCTPLTTHGHWALAEEAHRRVIKVLPEQQRRTVELSLAGLWMRQVTEEHKRLSAAGLSVPRKLASGHEKILKLCYTLQNQAADRPAELQKIRDLCDRVVDHYKILDYYDVAKAAIQVQEKKPADKNGSSTSAADEYAAFSLIRLDDELARRDLERQLKQYNASEKTELGAAFTTVLASWTKFIADHPTSPLVQQAVMRVFALGQFFEQKELFGEAATLYGDFAKFASKVPVLSQTKPGETNVVQQAAFAAAGALDMKGRIALTKWTVDRKSDDPAPTALSKEFTASIAAYKAFIETYPESPMASSALDKVMSIAYEYALIDAWDVADSVYADLLASKLTIRRPERLKFARGLCQLGQAMPQHAREVLQVLTGNGFHDTSSSSEAQMLAANFEAMHNMLVFGGIDGICAEGRTVSSSDCSGKVFFNDHFGDMSGYSFPVPASGGYDSSTRRFEQITMNGQTVTSSKNGMPMDTPAAACEPAPPALENPTSPACTKPQSGPASDVAGQSFGRISGSGSGGMGGMAGRMSGEQDLDRSRAERDVQMLAMIERQQASRASQVAQIRDNWTYTGESSSYSDGKKREAVYGQNQQEMAAPEVLSPAELARQEKAIDAAYKIFREICKEHADTPTAVQARGEILVMVSYWRSVNQWERSALLATRFLTDQPADRELPKLRMEIARDRLAWASKPVKQTNTKQERLVEVCKRFDVARSELAKIVTEFAKHREYERQAQWEMATSFLTQARVVNSFSPTLARGQYVRASKELGKLAETHPDHPQIGEISQMRWTISSELESQAYYEEAILVWNELTLYNPMDDLAQQAARKIANTYQHNLERPLRAAEAYQELNFSRGGNDQDLQNAIFQIGSELKNEKRWVEALHILESFVESFPKHPQAGQALTMVGQIHQTNEAWEDAIAAYRRVIDEFSHERGSLNESRASYQTWGNSQASQPPQVPSGSQWSQEAKWAIAECTINLSRWHEANEAYTAYIEAYPNDAKVTEANRRIELLKDLERYQGLVNEKGQRKAFDAQYQIAVIVSEKLSNPVKAIIEYRKVVKNWPESHLADDALYAIGTTYLSLGETQKARDALLQMAKKYPVSPLADDALFMVGKSYEEEATKLAAVTRESTIEKAKDVAQRNAYTMAQSNRKSQIETRSKVIHDLKQMGKGEAAEAEEASKAANYGQFNSVQTFLFAQKADKEIAVLSASQLADRQDKINAALRKAVDSFTAASKVAGADKADKALLQMATIYDTRLKDSAAAMQTWLEIVRQFSGTSVAEDASWRIAQYYQREGKYADAIEAYQAFLRNYRRSPNASAAQFAVAENCEKLDQWVQAMDAYTNYITNFPDGPLVNKAKEQINWIKTYRL